MNAPDAMTPAGAPSISPVAHAQARTAVVLAWCLVFLAGDKLVSVYRPALDLAVCGLALVLLLPVLSRAIVDIWPLLFAGWCAGSIMWTIDGFATQRAVIFTMPIFFVLLLSASALGHERALDAARLATQVICVVTLLYLLAYRGAAWNPSIDGAPGMRGPFGHKNGCGFFFAVTGFMWLPRRRETAGIVMLTIAVLGVVLSQSSTALILLAGGLVSFALLSRIFSRSVPGARATAAIVGLLLALGTLVVVVEYLGALTALVGKDVTLTGRVDIWAAVVPRVREHLGLGVGYGAPWTELNSFNAPMFRQIHFRPYHAHNGYLDTLLQIGVVGLVLLLGLWFTVLRRCVRASEHHDGLVVAMVTMLMLLVAGISETAPLLDAGLAIVGFLYGTTARVNQGTPVLAAQPAPPRRPVRTGDRATETTHH